MSTSEYEESLKSCIKKNEHVIKKLSELVTEAEYLHTVCNSVKTGGTTAGVAGTGLMIGSLIAAPFTGGASLAITLAAAGCSLGGAATNIITGMVDRSKSQDIIAEIQSLVDSREKVASKLKEQSDYFGTVIKHLVSSGMSEENAVNTTFCALANGSVDLKEAASKDAARTSLVTFGRIIQIEFDLLKTFQATYGAVSVLSATLPGYHQLIIKSAAMSLKEAGKLGIIGNEALKIGGQALKTGSEAVKTSGEVIQAGSQVLKTGGEAVRTGGQAMGAVKVLARAAVVTSVVISVVDVAFLIRDWVSDHPTIKVIKDIQQQLQEEREHFEELCSTIDSFRDRVYLVTIDGIPMISSISAGNDIMVALLNQDVPGCIEIFKKLDIEWPFERKMTEEQLFRFLIQHQAAKQFDEKRIQMVLQKRGKRASAAIICLVNEIVQLVKEKAKSALENKEKPKRSGRGEHVINNNVISVQRDIIDMFLLQRFGKTFGEMTRIPADSAIYRAYHQPFTTEVQYNIRYRMVAQIPDDVFYFDSNAVVYGTLIRILRDSARDHMSFLYNNGSPQGSPHTAALRTSRFIMNQMRIYVDDFALNYWLQCNGGNRTTYESSRLEVYRMFLNLDDQIRLWVNELKRFGY